MNSPDVGRRSFDEFGRLKCENMTHVPAFFRYPYPPTVQCLMTASVRTRPHASVVSSRGARAPVRSSRSRNSQYTIPRTNVAPASAPISRALETGIADRRGPIWGLARRRFAPERFGRSGFASERCGMVLFFSRRRFHDSTPSLSFARCARLPLEKLHLRRCPCAPPRRPVTR